MSILDAQLILSNNQAMGDTVTGEYNVISEKYIDFGATGTDTWGSGGTIYPGWWRPNSMVLVVKNGALPTTTMTVSIALSLKLYGTDSVTNVTSTIATQTLYLTKSQGALVADTGAWWFNKPYKTLWNIAVPKLARRYAFLLYSFYTAATDPKYAIMNAYINFDDQALAVGTYAAE